MTGFWSLGTIFALFTTSNLKTAANQRLQLSYAQRQLHVFHQYISLQLSKHSLASLMLKIFSFLDLKNRLKPIKEMKNSI